MHRAPRAPGADDLQALLTTYEPQMRRYIHAGIKHNVADRVHTDDVLQEVRVAIHLHSGDCPVE